MKHPNPKHPTLTAFNDSLSFDNYDKALFSIKKFDKPAYDGDRAIFFEVALKCFEAHATSPEHFKAISERLPRFFYRYLFLELEEISFAC